MVKTPRFQYSSIPGQGPRILHAIGPGQKNKYMMVGGSDGEESACTAGEPGSVSRSGRSPGEGNGYQLQHPYLENPIVRGVWQAEVHRVAKS